MLARVTTFEGGSAEGIRAASEQMRGNVGQGPPEGVKSVGLTMLAAPDAGRVLIIGLFESEQDMRDSEPALRGMTPPEGIGSRASVEVYEVAAEARM
ncbi:MAG TPA: hypothetical protein VFT42_01165 [Solirubrobacteraceae bacterium]|nr:hypothetical protein [Solirubrobacteraceae bacterium]